MIETMKIRYGSINPQEKGGKYIFDTIRIPKDPSRYEQFLDICMIPRMIPNSDNLEEMLEIIDNDGIYISWDSTGDGVFGIYSNEIIYSANNLELEIYRMYLNSL